MSFRLASEDDNTFTVQTPDGDPLVIAKAGLHPDAHENIRGLRKIPMAVGAIYGGKEADTEELPSDPLTVNNAQDKADDEAAQAAYDDPMISADRNPAGLGSDLYNGFKNMIMPPHDQPAFSGAVDQTPQEMMDKLRSGNGQAQALPPKSSVPFGPQPNPTPTSEAPQPMPSPQPQPPAEPSDMEMVKSIQQRVQGPALGMITDMQKALKDIAIADQAQGKRDTGTYKALSDQLNNIQTESDKYRKNLMDKNEEIYKGMMTNKLDPNKLWNDAGVGSKILATIGLALSGAGSGLSGQPNLAFAALDKAIDRDAHAQMQDRSNKMNLFKANLEQLRDIPAALNATRAQLTAATEAQIQKSKAMYNQAKAMPTANYLSAQLRQKMLGDVQVYTDKFIEMKMRGAFGTPGGFPADQVPTSIKGDTKKAETMVNVDTPKGQVSYFAANKEQADEANRYIKLVPDVQDDLDKLRDLAPKVSRWNPMNEHNASAVQLVSKLIADYNKIHAISPSLTVPDKQLIEKIIPNPTAWFTAGGDVGQLVTQLQESLNKGMASVMKHNLQGYPQNLPKPTITDKKEKGK